MRITSATAILSTFALAASLSVACSSDEPEATTSTTSTDPSGTGGAGTGGMGTGAMGTTTTGTGAGGEGPTCEAPRPPHPGNTFAPGTVTATILDQNTPPQPAAEMITDLCGTNICLVFGETDATGSVVLDGMDGDAGDPALLYGDGKEFAKFAAQVTPNSTDQAFGVINVLRLPEIASGSLLAEGDNTNSGVTLSIPTGANIDVDTLVYDIPSQATFRAVVQELDGSVTLPAVDPSLNLEVVIAMSPIDTVLCPGAGLTFPKLDSWTDGAEVELFVHGTVLAGHYAPYTQWAKVAEATVQGENVVTKDGEVIELIGTYGARLKQ